MKLLSLIVALSFSMPLFSHADSRVGGGGWGRGTFSMQQQLPIDNPRDMVRTLGVDRANIVFQVAKPGVNAKTIQMRKEEFTPETQAYLDALRKSAQTKQWEPVELKIDQ